MQTNVEEKNELAVIVDGLEKETQQTLLDNFLPLFEKAKDWKEKAEKLVVTDATQLTEMKQARDARLALKEIRVNADKVRKNLKEDSLRYGKAVQGVYNVIEYLIAPIETHLQEQEDFAKIAEAKRKSALKVERESLLQPFGITTDFYKLDEMDEKTFQTLYTNSKTTYEKQIEDAKKAEEERIAREQEEIKERERIRLENERLKEEAKAKEAEAKKEREAFEEKLREENRKAEAKNQLRKERDSILWKYGYRHDEDTAELSESDFQKLVAEEKSVFEDAEKKRIEAEQAEAEARERREAELKAEKEERLRVELELREKKDAEEKKEAARLAEIEAEASKGDKQKFQDLINDLEAVKKKYSFKSKKYKALGESVNELLDKTINWAIGKQ